MPFQSTHPLRGATGAYLRQQGFTRFQSTHPLRGATSRWACRSGTQDISIHAPLAGCDRYALDDHIAICISIHAPLAGCDGEGARVALEPFRISIHAPLAGCDCPGRRPAPGPRYFNPRTPCGVRQVFELVHFKYKRISIHAPLAGCDLRFGAVYGRVKAFQSTHPLRGATPPDLLNADALVFQSTHPLRGATGRLCYTVTMGRISIHAPLAGCDLRFGAVYGRVKAFQSTHPLRGATRNASAPPIHAAISIHAPLAGCDCGAFQGSPGHENFNPRTPCGVRLPCFSITLSPYRFQSTHPLRGATAKLPKYSRQICEKATKFLQSQTKSGVAACWAKGKRPLFPALRGASLPAGF